MLIQMILSNKELIEMVNTYISNINLVRPRDDLVIKPEWFDKVVGSCAFDSIFQQRFPLFGKLLIEKVKYDTDYYTNDNEGYNNLLKQFADAITKMHVDVNRVTTKIVNLCKHIVTLLSKAPLSANNGPIYSILIHIRNDSDMYYQLYDVSRRLEKDITTDDYVPEITNACKYLWDQPYFGNRETAFGYTVYFIDNFIRQSGLHY